MNLTKLFIICGIVLIATLGQTEGRRRWFKRKYKTIGCAGREKLTSIAKDVSDNHPQVDSDIEAPFNTTGRNVRRPNKWRRFKCGGNRCGVNSGRMPTTEINVNSTDTEINANSTKVPRRLRNNRRGQCSRPRFWRFNKVATVEGTNTTRSEVPLTHNTEEQRRLRNRNRKCKGRRARKGKCQPAEPHNNDPNEEEWSDVERSIENELHTDIVTTTEEPRENIH